MGIHDFAEWFDVHILDVPNNPDPNEMPCELKELEIIVDGSGAERRQIEIAEMGKLTDMYSPAMDAMMRIESETRGGGSHLEGSTPYLTAITDHLMSKPGEEKEPMKHKEMDAASPGKTYNEYIAQKNPKPVLANEKGAYTEESWANWTMRMMYIV